MEHIDQKYLDLFWKLSKTQENVRNASVAQIMKFLHGIQDKDVYLKYTLNRLVKGLKTTRNAARIGFANALTLMLRAHPEISTAEFVASIKKHIYQDVPENRAEKNGHRLGCAIAAGVLVKANRVNELSDSDVELVMKNLSKLLLQKTFTDCALSAIGDFASSLTKKSLPGALPRIAALFNADDKLGSGQILLLLKLKQTHRKLLKKSELPAYDLKEHTTDVIAALREGHEATAIELLECLADDNMETFSQFWSTLSAQFCDVNGSVKLKGLALKMAFSLVFSSKVSTDLIPIIMDANLCRVLHRQLSNKHYALFPSCAEFATKIAKGQIKDVERTTALFKAIVKEDCLFDLHNCSSSQILPSLVLHVTDQEVLVAYADALKQSYSPPRAVNGNHSETDDEDELTNDLVSQQQFITRQMRQLVTAGVLKRSNLKGILGFMLEKAMFKVGTTTELPASVLAMQAAFYKSLDQLATQRKMKKKYLEILCDLVEHSMELLTRKDTALIQKEPTTSNYLKSIQKYLQRAQEFLQKAIELDGGKLELHSSFALLNAHLCFHLLADFEDMEPLLKDVEECYLRATTVKSPSKKKRKTSLSDTTEGLHWAEVMTDGLLNLLSQPSHLLRTTVKMVFTRMVGMLTPACLQLIRDVLLSKPKSRREQEDEDDLVKFDDDMEEDMDMDEKEDEEETESEDESFSELGDATKVKNGVTPSDDDMDDTSEEEDEEMPESELIALRQRVQKALGQAAVDEEADEGVLSDSAMFQLDAALVSAFRAGRKGQGKRLEQEKKKQLNQLKMRCLDLFEVILTSSPNMEIVGPCLETLAQLAANFDSELQDRVVAVSNQVKKRSCDLESAHCDTAGEQLLEKLFELSMKSAPSAAFLSVLSTFIHFLDKNGFQEATVGAVKENLKDFMENRSSHLNKAIFGAIFEKSVNLLWAVRDQVLAYSGDETLRLYCRTQAFVLLHTLGKHINSLGLNSDDVRDFAEKVVRHTGSSVAWQSEVTEHPRLAQEALDLLAWGLRTRNDLMKDLPAQLTTVLHKTYPQLSQDLRRVMKKLSSMIAQYQKKAGSEKKKKEKKRKIEDVSHDEEEDTGKRVKLGD